MSPERALLKPPKLNTAVSLNQMHCSAAYNFTTLVNLYTIHAGSAYIAVPIHHHLLVTLAIINVSLFGILHRFGTCIGRRYYTAAHFFYSNGFALRVYNAHIQAYFTRVKHFVYTGFKTNL